MVTRNISKDGFGKSGKCSFNYICTHTFAAAKLKTL